MLDNGSVNKYNMVANIHLSSIIFLDEPYLVIRENLDNEGYYTIPVMKLTTEELDFKGGRFINYIGPRASKNKKNICYVESINYTLEIEKILNWVNVNCTGYWGLDVGFDYWIVSFENEHDAIMFRLFW